MIRNQAVKFGSNVDTDQIIGAHHLKLATIQEMVPYTFEMDERFVRDFKSGNIVVGERNFGCGSSREQAPAVMKAIGISAVIAKSFARIFYRNAINLGIPVLVCAQSDQINHGDHLLIDVENGTITNETNQAIYQFEPLAPFIKDILEQGGIVNTILNH